MGENKKEPEDIVVSVPFCLYEMVEEIIKKDAFGYKDADDFIRDAIRQYMKNIQAAKEMRQFRIG